MFFFFFKPPAIISCLLCVLLSVMWSGSEEENRSNDWKEKINCIISLKLVQKVTKTNVVQLALALGSCSVRTTEAK